MPGYDSTRQPAQQTMLGNDALGFQPQQTSPEIGLYLRTSTPQRPKNSAAILKNLHFDGNTWSPSGTGFKLVRDTAFNGGQDFKDFGIHWLENKTSRLVFQVGTKVYKYDPFEPDDAETLLFTAAGESIPCIRSFSPLHMIYTNGLDQPQNWDGTDWEEIDSFPFAIGSDAYTRPALCEVFQGRVAYSGFESLPFQVFISEFDDPAGVDTVVDSPARAGSYPVPSSYGPVTSLKSVRLSSATNEEVLIVGCKNGICLIQGTDSDSFSLIPVTNGFGIVNNRCWLKVDDTYLVLTTGGIIPMSVNMNISNLLNAMLSYHVHPAITARNSTTELADSQPFVIDSPERLEAVFYFPRGAETSNRQGLVLNYARLTTEGIAIFSEKEYPRKNLQQMPSCGINYGGMKLCGSYGGYLQSHWSGDLFGENPIAYRYRSALIDTPTPAQEGSMRMIQIMCEGSSQRFTAKGFVYSGTLEDQIRRQFSYQEEFESEINGETIIGAWEIGKSAFGGASYQIFNFYPKHAGRGWEVEINGSTSGGKTINLIGLFSTLIAGGTRQ